MARLSVETSNRDVTAQWVESGEIRIVGDGLDVLVEDEHVLVIDDSGGREELVLELPTSLPAFSAWLRHGNLRLQSARGKTEARLEGGSIDVRAGDGSLAISANSVLVDGFAGPVSVSAGSGEVTLLAIEGPISLEAGSGDLRLERGSGATAIKAGSGDLTIRDRRCSGLAIKAGSGDVTITGGAVQAVSAQSGSGEIRCRTELGASSHSFISGNGDIELGIPRNLAARIEAMTSSGRVDSDIPLVAVGSRGPKRQRGQRVVGSIGNLPERADITLRSASGDISLRWFDVFAASIQPVAPRPRAQAPEPSVTPAETNAEPARRKILEALAAGIITTDEAGRLLDSLDTTEH
jgi:hypothetical protein